MPFEFSEGQHINLERDLQSIKDFGIAIDFINELPGAWPPSDEEMNRFMRRCKNGEVRTYTQRYENKTEVLEKSDPQIVNKIDRLVEEIISAANNNNAELVKNLVQEILNLSSEKLKSKLKGIK